MPDDKKEVQQEVTTEEPPLGEDLSKTAVPEDAVGGTVEIEHKGTEKKVIWRKDDVSRAVSGGIPKPVSGGGFRSGPGGGARGGRGGPPRSGPGGGARGGSGGPPRSGPGGGARGGSGGPRNTRPGGGGRGGPRNNRNKEVSDMERLRGWIPKTELGQLVKDGKISHIKDAFSSGLPLREPEIIDILLPEMDDEVLDVNMVQRMTDSGRRVRFSITVVIGNRDGYVGLGFAKGKEVGPGIRKAIDNAKLHLLELKRGCGSWECGCGDPHTIPFLVKGKAGSAEVYLKPAPRGIGLAVGDVAKKILELAGVEDAWGRTSGQTRTTKNYAKATFAALKQTRRERVMPSQEKMLDIHRGMSKTQQILSLERPKVETVRPEGEAE